MQSLQFLTAACISPGCAFAIKGCNSPGSLFLHIREYTQAAISKSIKGSGVSFLAIADGFYMAQMSLRQRYALCQISNFKLVAKADEDEVYNSGLLVVLAF